MSSSTFRPAGIDYVAGDSFGVFPEESDPGSRRIMIDRDAMGARPRRPSDRRYRTLVATLLIGGRRPRHAPPDSLVSSSFSYVCGGDLRRQGPCYWRSGEDPDGDIRDASTCLACVAQILRSCARSAEAFVEASRAPAAAALLDLLLVAQRESADAISLTVDGVRYRVGPRESVSASPPPICRRALEHPGRQAEDLRAEGAWLSPSPTRPEDARSSWSAPAPASRRSELSCKSARRSPRQGETWLFFGHQRRAA